MRILVFIVLIVGAAFWVNSRIDLRGSYIKENVPPASEFDKLLQRDLLEYFRSNGLPESDEVKASLLHDQPSQSGVADPKYYVWVQIYSAGKQLEQGAVKVAAIKKQKFYIMDYVTQAQIRNGSVQIENIFPSALLPRVRQFADGVRNSK